MIGVCEFIVGFKINSFDSGMIKESIKFNKDPISLLGL